MLLHELRPHNAACQVLATRRVLHEWEVAAREDLSKGFSLAQDLWSVVRWDSVDRDLIVRTINLFREWLTDAKFRMPSDERARVKAVTFQLLLTLPADRLRDLEELFGPPMPSQFLGTIAFRESQRCHDEVRRLKEETRRLKVDNDSLRGEVGSL
eukprot:2346975-Amphidinium_carterae.1